MTPMAAHRICRHPDAKARGTKNLYNVYIHVLFLFSRFVFIVCPFGVCTAFGPILDSDLYSFNDRFWFIVFENRHFQFCVSTRPHPVPQLINAHRFDSILFARWNLWFEWMCAFIRSDISLCVGIRKMYGFEYPSITSNDKNEPFYKMHAHRIQTRRMDAGHLNKSHSQVYDVNSQLANGIDVAQ